MAGIELELREIRRGLAELNLKIDELLEERELTKYRRSPSTAS